MTLRLVSARDIRTGLRRIRWRRRLALALFLPGLPLVSALVRPLSPRLAALAAAVYAAVFLVMFHLWWWSRCPRCRGWFFSKSPLLGGNPFRRSCVECALRIDAVQR